MHTPVGSSTSVIWKNEILDGGKYVNEYHSTFRDGQYALMFSDFYGRGKDIGIVDLETRRTIKRYKFDENEYILNFRFPYLVSKTHENSIRIWDLNSDSKGPVNTIDAGFLRGIHRADIHENMLVIFSTQNKSMVPCYMTIIGDIEKPDSYGMMKPTEVPGVDYEAGLLMHEGKLILSLLCGSKLLVAPLISENKEEGTTIDVIKDYEAYIKARTKENYKEYENNIIKFLVAEGNRLVGSTEKAIKVWNLASGELMKEFSTEQPCQLFSLQGRFLFGTTLRFNPSHQRIINIWDTVTGQMLHTLINTSSHPIPHCVLYKDIIFHVNAKEEQIPDTVVQLPAIEQVKSEVPTPLQAPAPSQKEEPAGCTLM